MNYIGSKYTLLPFIDGTIKGIVGSDLSDKIFCDLFAGTGIVGRAFKPIVRTVISNDFEYYSYVLNRNYIGNHREIDNKQLYIDYLNSLDGIEDGFIFQNYCKASGSGRQYFSDENGRKIDAIRKQIEVWYRNQLISEDLYFFLLCSLLESCDKVANTASVYGAFLKHLKASALKQIEIKPALFSVNDNEHIVFCEDSNYLIKHLQGDILYMDPPYNERQYGANYHLLNTIARYKPFLPKGKTGLPEYQKSSYCNRRIVLDSFESLIKEAKFEYLFLSYNNEGLMSLADIERIMSKYGDYCVSHQEYHRFKADKEENRNISARRTIEYLHVLHKRG